MCDILKQAIAVVANTSNCILFAIYARRVKNAGSLACQSEAIYTDTCTLPMFMVARERKQKYTHIELIF